MNAKILTAVCTAIALFAMPSISDAAPKKDKESIENVYDLDLPSGDTPTVHIWVTSNANGARVSLIKGKPIKDLPEEEGITTKYLQLNNYGGEDNRAFSLYAFHKIQRDQWTKFVLSFTPRVDGKVEISLGSNYAVWHKDKEYPALRYCNLADFSIAGNSGKVRNPKFDKPKSWGDNPYHDKSWEKVIGPDIVKDKSAPGGVYLKTYRNMSQTFNVKKDVPVIFSFYVRADNMYEPRK